MAERKNTKPKKETPKETIVIKPTKEIKETKSVPITVELNILKVLINERPLIPLLRVLKKNKELHTRELLITMGSWGYGQSLMKRATNLGLITIVSLGVSFFGFVFFLAAILLPM